LAKRSNCCDVVRRELRNGIGGVQRERRYLISRI
jgi:hypothetical protein